MRAQAQAHHMCRQGEFPAAVLAHQDVAGWFVRLCTRRDQY